MKRILLFFLTTILSLLITASCSILPGNGSNQLNGTSWRLISYEEKQPIPGKDMTAKFDIQEVSGSASCNHYFGSYSVAGDRISIQGLGWTEMACLDPEGIMEQEQVLMKLFSESTSYSIQGNTLQISTSSGDLLLFERMDPSE
ncbi:MAG: META domain-containing protein [Anaerolineales bacterium]